MRVGAGPGDGLAAGGGRMVALPIPTGDGQQDMAKTRKEKLFTRINDGAIVSLGTMTTAELALREALLYSRS